MSKWLVGCSTLLLASAGACDGDGAGTGAEVTSSVAAGGAAPETGGGGAGGGQSGSCEAGPQLRVLFIGNSHTYVNDVPALVRELACSAGTNLLTQTVALPGASLVDHANDPAVLEVIASEAWDFVVLQDQQQRPGFRLPEVDASSAPAAVTLVDAIRDNDATTVPLFYMVWARQGGDVDNCDYYPLLCTYEGGTRAVSEGYGLYAERTATDVIPVALAWASVVADPTAPLSAGELWSDGSHATVAGSYLAAAMITQRLLMAPSASLTYDAGLGAPVSGYLRSTSEAALAAHLANPRVDTAERVQISCDDASGCASWPDTSPVVLALTGASCAEIAAGSAAIAGRIRTTLDCSTGPCITVPLGGWRDVQGAALAEGSYSVHAFVDLDDDGTVDTGELEACEDGAFVVGGGVDLVISTFAPRG